MGENVVSGVNYVSQHCISHSLLDFFNLLIRSEHINFVHNKNNLLSPLSNIFQEFDLRWCQGV